MLTIIGRLIISMLSLIVVEYILPGFMLRDITVVFIAAVVIGVINTFIRPILQIIALPISILTLGITAFIINVLLLMLAARIVPGFEIDTLLTAAVASILISLVTAFLHKLSNG